MTKGHIFLAQNSDVNYVRQAYALALSIKIFNKTYNQTCLLTNDVVPQEYQNVFDYILPIPDNDLALNSNWKIENRWKFLQVTPFEENFVYDVDMLLLESNDHWWQYFKNKNICFTKNVENYRGNIITNNFYRKSFTKNDLPNVYSGVFYFKKNKESIVFFEWLKIVVNNWKMFYDLFLKNHKQDFCSLDVSAAIVVKILDNKDIVLDQTPILKFVHMKPGIQDWGSTPNKWTNVVDFIMDKDLNLFVGNFKQTGLFHYVEDEFLTDQILNLLYEKNKKVQN